MDRIRLSVVVPCFNEEARLPATLGPARQYLEQSGRAFELIVVDDGSGDRTAAVVRELAGGDPRVTLVSLPRNRGKGRALAEGVARTTGSLVLVSDADFSAPLDELPKLEARIESGADVAIGSRARPGAREVDQPLHRRVMGKAFNLLVQAMLLPGIWDTQCGFKLFRGEVARELFARLCTEGFAYDIEVLYRARRAGYRVDEVPVRWINSSTTRVHALRHSREMLMDLLRVRFAL